MKLYLTIVTLVIMTFALFGFVLPFLISAAATELVLFGWALIVLYPIAVYKLSMSIVNQIKSKV